MDGVTNSPRSTVTKEDTFNQKDLNSSYGQTISIAFPEFER